MIKLDNNIAARRASYLEQYEYDLPFLFIGFGFLFVSS